MVKTQFGLANTFDSGIDPSVTINSTGRIAEAHQSQRTNRLWIRVGQASRMDVLWMASHDYTSGHLPSVALNDANVLIEAHESEAYGKIYTRLASIATWMVDWKWDAKLCEGHAPTIALNNAGMCVIAYRRRSGGEWRLYCRAGLLKKEAIDWGDEAHFDRGYDPSIAINSHNDVVEIHEDHNQGGTLFLNVGKLSNGTVSWGTPQQIGKGRAPSIALNDDGLVTVLHTGDSPSPDIHQKTGRLVRELKSVHWEDAVSLEAGLAPSVALSITGGRFAIRLNQGAEQPPPPPTSEAGETELCFSTSLVHDRRKWMTSYRELLSSVPLYQLTIPGSHDSGTYSLSTRRAPTGCRDLALDIPGALVRPYSIAQGLDMDAQLSEGIRFFDCRVYEDHGVFKIYHDCIGVPISEILDSLVAFLTEPSRELVVLKFSHFCSFEEAQHARLTAELSLRLRDVAYVETEGNILERMLGELTASGSRVVIWYDSSYLDTRTVPGLTRHLSLYDEYSKSDDFSLMRDDQQKKLREYGGTSSRLFLLSWTLTVVGFFDVLNYTSLRELADTPSRLLGAFMEKNDFYATNIVFSDFVEDSRAADCAIVRSISRALEAAGQPV